MSNKHPLANTQQTLNRDDVFSFPPPRPSQRSSRPSPQSSPPSSAAPSRPPPAPPPRRSGTSWTWPPSSAAGSTPARSPAAPCGTSCSCGSAAPRLFLTPTHHTHRGTCSPSSAPAAAATDPPCTAACPRTPRRRRGCPSGTA